MPYRIIVADKDPGTRNTVSDVLQAGDNAFTEVSGSGELKRAIKDQRPDLIIMNALLSDAPGWKIVPRIKDSQDYANIPILLLTGDPGSPPPSELHSSGADAYLPKPIDGAALKRKVESLLGIAGGDLAAEEDSDIVIEFSDDDSGDMTEELLAMSSVALTEEELSPDALGVGDTVEIDTAAPAEELDEPTGVPGGDVYEDTVRLNLDDMSTDMLDVEDEGFEPTIELVTDSGVGLDLDPSMDDMGIEIDEPDITEPLPDFSSAISEVTDTGTSLKDSVTVDMDVDDLGLELDTEGITETSVTVSETRGIDPDDPEIGQLLEVQDPSMILTSKDLDLSDEYLEGDPTSRIDTGPTAIDEIDVIDLEDDTEIREVEIEDLESIHTPGVDSVGIDLDSALETDGLELEMDDVHPAAVDEIAGPRAGAVPPIVSDDLTVDVEPTIEIAAPLEAGPDELSLDDVTAEEMTTEEFFGEELPTEEFPTAKYPDDSTSEIEIEDEITLEGIDLKEDLSLQVEAPIVEPPPTRDLVEPSEEFLVDEALQEDEPMLEVTEDISFQEMGLEPAAEAAPSARPRVPEPVPAAAAVSVAAIEQALPSLEEMRAIFQSVLADRMKEAVPGRQTFTDSLGTAFIDRLPQKTEFSETFSKSVAAAVPDADHLVTAIMDQIAPSVPSREEIFARVDKLVAEALPSGEAIFERLDETMKGVLPHSDVIEKRVEEALTTVRLGDLLQASVDKALAAVPSIESLNRRLDEALSAVPSRDEVAQRLDSALESIPSREAVENRLEKALAAIPSKNEISERVAEALGAMPSTEEVSQKLDKALEAIPTSEEVSERLGKALGAIPTREEVSDRLAKALAAVPTADAIQERLQESLDALPSEDVLLRRLDSAILDILPTVDTVEDRMGKAFEAFPSKAQINQRLDDVLDAVPNRPEIMGRIDEALETIPTQDVVLARLDERFGSVMPVKNEFAFMLESILQKSVDQAMAELDPVVTFKEKLPTTEQIVAAMKAALPDRERFRETLIQSITQSIQNSLPERMWLESVSRGLFDERTKGLLPDRDEVVNLLREEIRIRLLDTVERILKDQIQKITSEIYS